MLNIKTEGNSTCLLVKRNPIGWKCKIKLFSTLFSWSGPSSWRACASDPVPRVVWVMSAVWHWGVLYQGGSAIVREERCQLIHGQGNYRDSFKTFTLQNYELIKLPSMPSPSPLTQKTNCKITGDRETGRRRSQIEKIHPSLFHIPGKQTTQISLHAGVRSSSVFQFLAKIGILRRARRPP